MPRVRIIDNLILQDGARVGDVGVETLDYVVKLLFNYAAAEF